MYRPPDPETFNKVVWAIVRQIPAGRVSTYGQIASMIPPPEGVEPPEYDSVKARWVGVAMRDSPDDLPWQRVINYQGAISLPKGSAGAEKQRALLEMEGVAFDARGRVDFDTVGWRGPGDIWLADHNLLPPRPLSTDGDTQLTLF